MGCHSIYMAFLYPSYHSMLHGCCIFTMNCVHRLYFLSEGTLCSDTLKGMTQGNRLINAANSFHCGKGKYFFPFIEEWIRNSRMKWHIHKCIEFATVNVAMEKLVWSESNFYNSTECCWSVSTIWSRWKHCHRADICWI